jgi:hypothetical protein
MERKDWTERNGGRFQSAKVSQVSSFEFQVAEANQQEEASIEILRGREFL